MRHYEEPVMGYCKTCCRPFCNRCLVFPFGDDKPPYCVSCAIAASGVRNANKRVAIAQPAQRTTWSERSQARSTKRALKKAERQQKPILGDDPRSTTVPVPKGLPTPASRFRRQKADATSVD
jgi:hypothetical protein